MSENVCLYKFHWDCGRMGDVEGLFIASEKEVNTAISKEVYFGEILGKHSEIFGILESDDLKVISTDSNVISVLEDCFSDTRSGEHWSIVGYCPLDYLTENRE